MRELNFIHHIRVTGNRNILLTIATLGAVNTFIRHKGILKSEEIYTYTCNTFKTGRLLDYSAA